MKLVHIFFIACAGDKERFYILWPVYYWGPLRYSADYCNEFSEKMLPYLNSSSKLYTYYRSYKEAEKIQAEIIKIKQEADKSKNQHYIAIIGHSYGAACAFRLTQDFTFPIDLLILVDPVGSGYKRYFQNIWLSKLDLTAVNATAKAAAVVKTNLYRRGNIIAYFGRAWGRNKALLKYLTDNFNPLIKLNEKNCSIGHARLKEILKFSTTGQSLEDLLTTKIKLFISH